jgi:ATP-dependent RNA helicase RhlE
VLVATDIAARGIDVTALGHVVNFDVPNVPEDYIHRVGRTARAELTGEAYTFVSADEEAELRAIEKAISRRLQRVTLPDFDYHAKASAKLEIPLAERIAAIRAKKAEDRARAAAKLARRDGAPSGQGARSASPARPAPRGGASHAGASRPASQGSAAPRPSAPRPSSNAGAGARRGDESPYASSGQVDPRSRSGPRRRRGGGGNGPRRGPHA